MEGDNRPRLIRQAADLRKVHQMTSLLDPLLLDAGSQKLHPFSAEKQARALDLMETHVEVLWTGNLRMNRGHL